MLKAVRLFGLTHVAPTTHRKRARNLLRVGLLRLGSLRLLTPTLRRARGCRVVEYRRRRRGFRRHEG
eukprot:1983440-Heterocapsa_arctica.AAC.1